MTLSLNTLTVTQFGEHSLAQLGPLRGWSKTPTSFPGGGGSYGSPRTNKRRGEWKDKETPSSCAIRVGARPVRVIKSESVKLCLKSIARN